MEHRFMKQLNSTFTKNILQSNLSSYPALDFINPGLGNIVQPYGLYVPIHYASDIYQQTKSKPVENKLIVHQEGTGNIPLIEKEKKEKEKKEESDEKNVYVAN
jgi:hypothetical protein